MKQNKRAMMKKMRKTAVKKMGQVQKSPTVKRMKMMLSDEVQHFF